MKIKIAWVLLGLLSSGDLFADGATSATVRAPISGPGAPAAGLASTLVLPQFQPYTFPSGTPGSAAVTITNAQVNSVSNPSNFLVMTTMNESDLGGACGNFLGVGSYYPVISATPPTIVDPLNIGLKPNAIVTVQGTPAGTTASACFPTQATPLTNVQITITGFDNNQYQATTSPGSGLTAAQLGQGITTSTPGTAMNCTVQQVLVGGVWQNVGQPVCTAQ